ncbi:hypothetical protein [Mycobacterium conspicuum]|jgi:hypothetical protein|uniref:Uncharacterized protein n=1 Tax=Mycobacterium conspicuum TaxID=44010 RepID=A0A1X1T0S2_9MYCO|nr:hypothetical protein [Mycobacterium conspicuum]ORV37780.1 hypothetical protein AWC00_22585 [Mycobacterium conspicuum]BBZ41438.1 hypothetical protein MCNS_45010 [Mycobacterium conspicuum]
MTKRVIPAAQLILAGAATAATLALFNVAQANAAAGGFATDDPGNFVNDNGQTSGDIFTQNAQDQSTASGAGTS